MNNKLQGEIKRYKRKIRQKISLLEGGCGDVCETLFEQIDDFVAEHPEAGGAMLREHFGSPEMIVSSIVSPESMVDLARRLRRRRVGWIALTVVLAIFLVFAGVILNDMFGNRDNYHEFSNYVQSQKGD